MSEEKRYSAVVKEIPAGTALEDFAAEQAAALGNGVWGLVYTSDRVFFLRGSDAAALRPKLCGLRRPMELRLFNKTGECRLWNSQGVWKSRRILDNPDDAESADRGALKKIALWGSTTLSDGDGAYVMLEEGRGCRFGFPCAVDKNRLPLTLQICNYYEYNDDGMLGFVDTRLVDILDKTGGEL